MANIFLTISLVLLIISGFLAVIFIGILIKKEYSKRRYKKNLNYKKVNFNDENTQLLSEYKIEDIDKENLKYFEDGLIIADEVGIINSNKNI